MTAYTQVQTATANPSFRATTVGTCTFTQSSLQFNCSLVYTDTTGFATTNTNITTYASVADIVDEVSVIPPLMRPLSVSGTTTSGGTTTTSSGTFTYDAQKRITRQAYVGGTTTTYSAWDSAGRPTAATAVGSNGQTTTLTMTYDNNARSMTTANVQGGVTTSCTQSYDVNGNPTTYECSSSIANAGTTNGTTTVASTAQLCR
jgi:YD repeat-containing protein